MGEDQEGSEEKLEETMLTQGSGRTDQRVGSLNMFSSRKTGFGNRKVCIVNSVRDVLRNCHWKPRFQTAQGPSDGSFPVTGLPEMRTE